MRLPNVAAALPAVFAVCVCVCHAQQTAAELQEKVEEALDKKLKPVMKLLAEAQQSGPSAVDILGGIGYIFGLVGVAAYFSARRERSK